MDWLELQLKSMAHYYSLSPAEQVIKKPEIENGALTECLAIDCEFVGVTKKDKSALARVSIVNYDGDVVYDKYSKPELPVTNYRTWVSGILPKHLKNGLPFKKCQNEVKNIIKGRILIGHAIQGDLKVLKLQHPQNMIRDTSTRDSTLCPTQSISLKNLAKQFLDLEVQVEDARITLLLFKLVENKWGSVQNSKYKKKKKYKQYKKHKLNANKKRRKFNFFNLRRKRMKFNTISK